MKYHKCKEPVCETTMSEGSPEYCPKHQVDAPSDTPTPRTSQPEGAPDAVRYLPQHTWTDGEFAIWSGIGEPTISKRNARARMALFLDINKETRPEQVRFIEIRSSSRVVELGTQEAPISPDEPTVSIDDLERENAELRAALDLGQENCDDVYNDLKRERDEAKRLSTDLHAMLDRVVKEAFDSNDTIGGEHYDEYMLRKIGELKARVAQLESAKPEHWLPKSVTVADIAAEATVLRLDRDRLLPLALEARDELELYIIQCEQIELGYPRSFNGLAERLRAAIDTAIASSK